jgi:hypothetical protein
LFDPPLNFGAWHREQAIHQICEPVVFFRRAFWHFSLHPNVRRTTMNEESSQQWLNRAAGLIAALVVFGSPIMAVLRSAQRNRSQMMRGVHSQGNASNQSNPSNQSTPAQDDSLILQAIQSEIAQRERYERGTTRRDRMRLGVETLAFIGVAVAVYFTFRQLQLTREQFIIDQRPWLLVGEIKLSEIKPEDTETRAELVFVNYGKSPATSVAFDRIDVTIHSPGTTGRPTGKITVGVIGPDGKFQPAPPIFGDSQIIGPSAKHSVFIRAGLRPGQYENVQRGIEYPYVSGIIKYSDGFGNKHQTEFCYVSDQRVASEAPDPKGIQVSYGVRPCSSGNDAQ